MLILSRGNYESIKTYISTYSFLGFHWDQIIAYVNLALLAVCSIEYEVIPLRVLVSVDSVLFAVDWTDDLGDFPFYINPNSAQEVFLATKHAWVIIINQ